MFSFSYLQKTYKSDSKSRKSGGLDQAFKRSFSRIKNPGDSYDINFVVSQKKLNKYREIPKINGELPLGNEVRGQWVSRKHRFVVVAEDEVAVYAKPKLDSLLIAYLPLTKRVRVNYKSPKKIDFDGQDTNWVFVSTTNNKWPIGWVVDKDLGYKNSFEVVKDYDINDFKFEKGEYSATINFQTRSIYQRSWKAQGKDILLEGKQGGKALLYKNVIWLKKIKPNIFKDFFILSSNGELSHEYKFKSEELIHLK